MRPKEFNYKTITLIDSQPYIIKNHKKYKLVKVYSGFILYENVKEKWDRITYLRRFASLGIENKMREIIFK